MLGRQKQYMVIGHAKYQYMSQAKTGLKKKNKKKKPPHIKKKFPSHAKKLILDIFNFMNKNY